MFMIFPTSSQNGDTAMMTASSSGHSSVVRKLLQAGATVNTTNKYGHPALYFAASKGHEDVVELLLGAKADPDLTDMVRNFNTHCYERGNHSTLYWSICTSCRRASWEGRCLC